MTSPARVAANRINARRSTGPRTEAGKLRSALNAVRHGLYARIALVPALGENPADWAAHRIGIHHALAPVGGAEEAVAGRIALLLWQQRRVAVCPPALDTATLPPDPDVITGAGVDHFVRVPPDAPPAARLAHTRAAATSLRAQLAHHRDAAAALGGADIELGVSAVLAATAAAGLFLGWSLFVRPNPWAAILGGLGVEAEHPAMVPWTADLLRQAVGRAGGLNGRDPKVFLADVLAAVESGGAAMLGKLARMESEEAARVAELQRARADAAAEALFAADGRGARVERAEAHLSRELDRALGQLARLRTLRPPPSDPRLDDAGASVGFVLRATA